MIFKELCFSLPADQCHALFMLYLPGLDLRLGPLDQYDPSMKYSKKV